MTLGQKQELFVRCLWRLLRYAEKYARRTGLTVRGDEWYRPPETAALYARQKRGIRNSLHTQKLAIDLNLIREGRMAPAIFYRPLGRVWTRLVARESEDQAQGMWGGDFRRPDHRHFSIRHRGVA